MTTMPSDSIDVARNTDAACHWGIRAAWRLSLVWGALVSLLAWTGGAAAMTAVIRGAVAFFAVGLLGFGLNAVMAHAGARCAEESHSRGLEEPDGSATEAVCDGDETGGAGADEGVRAEAESVSS